MLRCYGDVVVAARIDTFPPMLDDALSSIAPKGD